MSKVIAFPTAQCGCCGKRMDGKFLRPWNGIDACGPCIQSVNEEAEAVEQAR